MKEGDSRSSKDSGARLFTNLRALLFGEPIEPSLRDQIEEVIAEHEDEPGPDAEGDLSQVERQMVRNLLHFGERTVDDVAVPRSDIIAVPETTGFTELVARFAEAGHSRLPVYRDSLDAVTGMVHLKDLFAILAAGGVHPDGIADLIRQPLYVPQSMGVLDLLAEMRRQRVHLAIVIDEYSGTEGLVTIEDLVEEIVGDIEDEHDDAPEALLVPLDDGMWEADARAELDDVATAVDARLGIVDEDVDTIGGLAFVLAGHVPQPGETLQHASGWRIEIVDGDARRATRVRLHPPVETRVEA
jgi:magnesium and cobalt transporter